MHHKKSYLSFSPPPCRVRYNLLNLALYFFFLSKNSSLIIYVMLIFSFSHSSCSDLLLLPRDLLPPVRRRRAARGPTHRASLSSPKRTTLPPPPPGASQAKHAGRSSGGGNLPRPAIGSGWRRPTPAVSRAVAQAGGDQGCRAGGGDEEITSAARVPDLDPIRIWVVAARAVVRTLCPGAASGLWTRPATRGRRGLRP